MAHIPPCDQYHEGQPNKIEGHYNIYTRRWRDHADQLIRLYGVRMAQLFLAIVGAVVLLAEATSLVTSTATWHPAVTATLIIAGMFATAIYGYLKYINHIPDGFSDCTKDAARLAHLKPPLWEPKLASELLSQRTKPIDEKLANILDKKVATEDTQCPDPLEYCEWISQRLSIAQSYLDIFNSILFRDLAPNVLVRGGHASPLEIKKSVDLITKFYERTVEFEQANTAVVPPSIFPELRDLQVGWLNPIREGIHQVTHAFDELGQRSRDQYSNDWKFGVVLREPKEVLRFSDEYQARISAVMLA